MDLAEIAMHAVKNLGSNQHPQELYRYLAWLAAEGPKYIVEVGVESGGTSWAVQAVCPDAVRLQVDMNPPKWPLSEGGIKKFFQGTSAEMAREVRAHYDPKEAVVFIDADHRYANVVEDTINYPGKFQAYHDIHWMKGNQAPKGQSADRFYQEHKDCCFCQTFEAGWAGIGIRRPKLCREKLGEAFVENLQRPADPVITPVLQ